MKNGFDIFLKSVGVIAFVADSIAIYLFIRHLFVDDVSSPSQRTISLGIAIILVFVFAMSLIRFSGEASNRIFIIFGTVYAVYAAGIFGIGFNIMLSSPSLGWGSWEQIFIYLGLGVVVSAFSYIVTKKSEFDLKWASIPLILVSIFQIASVLITLFNENNVPLYAYAFLMLEMVIISIFLTTDTK